MKSKQKRLPTILLLVCSLWTSLAEVSVGFQTIDRNQLDVKKKITMVEPASAKPFPYEFLYFSGLVPVWALK
jgi:hypothetical protein